MRSTYKILVENRKRKGHLKHQNVDGREKNKMNWTEIGLVACGIDSSW
jgi:hypothetical protein